MGYWLDHCRFEVGLLERRAKWLADWTDDVLQKGQVLVRRMSEVLGRFSHAFAALDWHRPFLGPLHAWTAAAPPGACLGLPVLVRLTLGYLRDRLRAGSFMTAAVAPVSNPDIAYLADAHASDEGVGIGGWERVEGRPLQECRWFSLS